MSRLTMLLVILSLTALSYAPTWRAGFAYEDMRTVFGAPQVQQTASWVPHQLRSLSVLSFRLNHVLDGNNPRGYHAFNVLIHLVNVVLVYLIAATLLENDLAVLVAVVIFALSPLQVESVAYVTGRTELLAAAAVLGAIYATIRASAGIHMLAAAALLLAGLLTKETAAVGFVLVPLMYLYLYGSPWQFVKRSPWLVPLIGAVSMIVLLAIWLLAPVRSVDTGLLGSERSVPAYIAIQCAAMWRYVFAALVPYDLTIDHDYDLIPHWLAYAALFLTIGVGVWAWRNHRAHAFSAFCIAWVLMSLAPRFLVRIPEYLNEHQMYVPMVGVSLFLGHHLARLVTTYSERHRYAYMD